MECGKHLDCGTKVLDLLGITFSFELCKISSINYSKVEKNELSKWEIRYMTPIGKISVLKTQIIPKLNLFCNFSAKSEPHFTRTLNDICYKFIWVQNQ